MIREGGSYEEETCEHDFMCGHGGVHGLSLIHILGIKKNIIGYVRLFSPDKNANDKIRILDIAENNYPLFGMWWLFKDVRNININEDGTVNKKAEYKHIDNVMTKISKVRNAMEHGYLKIIDTYCKELFIDDSRLDKLAYNISFEDYEKLTLQLLKYVREAIVLLVFSVKREEEIKESHRSSDEILAPMYTCLLYTSKGDMKYCGGRPVKQVLRYTGRMPRLIWRKMPLFMN